VFNGITKRERSKNRDAYAISTIPHPQLERLASWYSSGEKKFPSDMELTPKIVKHWYCCDGGLNWPGNSDSGASACFYSVNEDGADLVNLFEDAGFTVNNHADHRIYFPREETQRLLGWMGRPPDGFEYKWEWSDKDAYKELKQREPITPDSLDKLATQLNHVAGQIENLTTRRDKQEHAESAVSDVRNDYERKVSKLKESHDAKLKEEKAKVEKRVGREVKKQTRDMLLHSVYTHPEVDVSERILAECADLSQQMVNNILREQR